MEYKIFYSWQSDLPRKLTRDIICGAATDAVKRMTQSVAMEDSPRLDSDTERVSGSPDIANTIYGKIDEADVFLADLSIIARTVQPDQNKKVKALSNPNVMLELGYAAARLGWNRIILIMNTAYGSTEELPFDLKNRRFPLTYKLAPESRKDVEKIQADISENIEFAVLAAIRTELLTVQEAIAGLDYEALKIMKRFGNGDGLIPIKYEMTLFNVLDHMTISRLLSHKILACHPSANLLQYEYHWTHLGKLVLEKLGMRIIAQERRPITDITESSIWIVNP